MSEAGYATAMFGKWAHSSQVQGYEPWHAGFAESYVRSKYEPDMLLRWVEDHEAAALLPTMLCFSWLDHTTLQIVMPLAPTSWGVCHH